jgi:hypothetical protein
MLSDEFDHSGHAATSGRQVSKFVPGLPGHWSGMLRCCFNFMRLQLCYEAFHIFKKLTIRTHRF